MSEFTSDIIPGRVIEWEGWTPRERANLERVLAERDRQIAAGERKEPHGLDIKHRLALCEAQKRRREREKAGTR